MTVAVLTVIRSALQELGVLNPIDPPSSEDAGVALDKLRRILDNMNAERQMVWANQFVSYTLTPGLNPHTIGPSGTWTRDVRPASLSRANLILDSVTPNIYMPIQLHDSDWWMNQRIQALQQSIPTDGVYSAEWPDGQLLLWPVPTVAYGIQLMLPVLVADVGLGDDLDLPQGYWDAVTLTLAEDCAAPFRVQPSTNTVLKARQARARIAANNSGPMRIKTCDAGLPGRGAETFNWRTGMRG